MTNTITHTPLSCLDSLKLIAVTQMHLVLLWRCEFSIKNMGQLSRYGDGLRTARSGLIPGRGRNSSPKRADQLWVQSNGYRGSLPGDKAAGTWNWPLISIYC
jgi:hypothetical protein